MWPIELRERCTQRLLSANPPQLIELAVETGVPASTLGRWRTEAKNPRVACHAVFMTTDRRPTDWPAAERLRVLNETSSLSDEELGEYLRREGLHSDTLALWRADALAGLAGAGGTSARPTKTSRRERELERELRRKEKALAETAALLVLQKKARQLFGDAEDDSSSGT